MVFSKIFMSALAVELCLDTVEAYRVSNHQNSSLIQAETAEDGPQPLAVDEIMDDAVEEAKKQFVDGVKDAALEAAQAGVDTAAKGAASGVGGAVNFVDDLTGDHISDADIEAGQNWFVELPLGYKMLVIIGICLVLLVVLWLIKCILKTFCKGCWWAIKGVLCCRWCSGKKENNQSPANANSNSGKKANRTSASTPAKNDQ